MVNDNSPESDSTAMLVVGLGASAGGIGALRQFFTHSDAELEAAYVVILHLSPDHDSRLAEVLQTATSMPVEQVTDAVTLQARHVYVVSPNHSLTAKGDLLTVAPMTRLEQRRSPVDIFFRTLADAHGARAVAIILSGTGTNGSNGLKRIKEYGGLAIAQSPDEAEYRDMPRNAIATGLVDVILPVAEIPARIAAFYDRLGIRPEATDAADPPADAAPDHLPIVVALLRARTGHDFSNYKLPTLHRRIARRMSILGLNSLPAYADAIRDRPEEATALMKELLISVTNFFRDPEAFAALAQRVVPRILEGKRSLDQVRAWVAGCATGEEAYSIAMLLAEAASRLPDPPTVQVFATDLDRRAITVAREGFYSEADVADVREDRVQRFFQRESGGYRVRRELREIVLFAEHNLIKDPPFSHLDLVSCRNLLIYLNRSIQDRVIETFHFALRPGGYLFLGTSESPDGSGDLFATVDKNAHLYECRPGASRLVLPAAGPLPRPDRDATRLSPSGRADRPLPADLHQRLLEQYAPPSLIVSDEHQVVHVSEHAAEYLQISGGEPSRDVLKLVRPELRTDLRAALLQASQQRASIEVPRVRFHHGDTDSYITLIIRPVVRDYDPAHGFFLILFADPANGDPATTVPLVPEPAAQQLEDEVSRLKTQLRLTVEQYETQVEEAKASNEELQAMNEELRSAAEELETSKEELQSVNEELTTVNQELKIKIDELAVTNNNYQNLINSTNLGTIFLDRGLRVRMSTPGAQEIFNLLPGDIGRPLSDLTSSLVYEGLHQDIRKVLERLHTVERQVKSRQGRWFLIRILPYRTADDRIDGVVLTFVDITERRNAELAIRASEERFRLLVESAMDYAIFTMDLDGIVNSWNPGAERMFGYTAAEILGTHAEVLFTPEDRAARVPDLELGKAALEGRAEDERWHLRKDGSRLYCSGVTTLLGGERPIGLAKIARDLTGQRQAQLAVEEAQAALDIKVRDRTIDLRAEVALHAAAEQHVTRLMRKLVTSQEDQRARIARDLHDHLGQQLTALRLTLERHRERCTEQGREDAERAIAQTKTIDEEVDFLAWELRPAVLDDLGLAVALPRYVAEWSQHYGVTAECRTTGFVRGQLAATAEVTFYRIAQEALNNVLKHAHASQVNVILESRDGLVTLVIEDDGVGFDHAAAEKEEAGLGLAGMRERAALIGASLEIESVPAQGTTIFVRCPVLRSDAEASA